MRTALYATGMFIVGSVTCLAYAAATLFFFAVLVTIIGVWGGVLWAILWLLGGLPLSLALAGILSFPLRLLGAGLVALSGKGEGY